MELDRSTWPVTVFVKQRESTLQGTIHKVPLVFLFSVLVINTSCISSAQPNKQSAASSLTWRTNPAYAGQLASVIKVDEFRISPPAGFTLQKKQFHDSTNVGDRFDWQGRTRTDGTRPRFVVMVRKALPSVNFRQSAEEQLKHGLDSAIENHYIHTPIEHGKVNGMSFVRAYWKPDPRYQGKGKRYHGFQYMYSQGATTVSIVGDDVEQHYQSTHDLLESAALAFHK